MSIAATMETAMYGHRIAEARKNLGLSQRALAQKIGRSQGFISDIEKGRIDPSFDFLVKLQEACGIDPTWIVTGLGDAPAGRRRQLKDIDPVLVAALKNVDFAENQTGYSVIKRHDMRISNGSIQFPLSSNQDENIAFTTARLHEMGLSPERICLVRTHINDITMPTTKAGTLSLAEILPEDFKFISGNTYIYAFKGQISAARLAADESDPDAYVLLPGSLYRKPEKISNKDGQALKIGALLHYPLPHL